MATPKSYDDVVAALKGLLNGAAEERRPVVQRWQVISADPLVVQSLTDDVTLEEGDPDVEIDRAVLRDRPDVGELVRVHEDAHGDWIIAGVIA